LADATTGAAEPAPRVLRGRTGQAHPQVDALLDIYHRHLPRSGRAITVVGRVHGGSLRMWRDYSAPRPESSPSTSTRCKTLAEPTSTSDRRPEDREFLPASHQVGPVESRSTTAATPWPADHHARGTVAGGIGGGVYLVEDLHTRTGRVRRRLAHQARYQAPEPRHHALLAHPGARPPSERWTRIGRHARLRQR
jgi:hypothetical protein